MATADTDYANGRIVAADLSLTVINDNALEALRTGALSQSAKETLLEKNSYYFAKTIILPQP